MTGLYLRQRDPHWRERSEWTSASCLSFCLQPSRGCRCRWPSTLGPKYSTASLIKVNIGKDKDHKITTAPLSEGTSLQKRSGKARVVEGFHSFTCHPRAFIHEWNEPYLPLPSKPMLVLIYQPQRDERLS